MADEKLLDQGAAQHDPFAMVEVLTRPHRNSLHDATRWTDATGKTWLLEDMTPTHRKRLLRMLRGRADRLAFDDALAWMKSPFMPHPDTMASDDASDALDWQVEHAGEWLESTPLVKRLAELVEMDEQRQASIPEWWDAGE